MPLISPVGRKSIAVRLLVAALYVILITGAVSMVYPFLLMVSGSFKTTVDQYDFDVFPSFIRDDTVLYRKHLECKYNNSVSGYNTDNRMKVMEFKVIEPPEPVHAQRVADWKRFETDVAQPPTSYIVGYTGHSGDRMRLWKHREFRARLMELSGGDIERYNESFEARVESWEAVGTLGERLTERRYQLSGSALEAEFYRFKTEQP
ncbi:MAG TPA: hypothetical protein VMY39_10030, partial [Planctomycetota bacterium]|nr:hypothetical protein [Planctomycetota bacterium]